MPGTSADRISSLIRVVDALVIRATDTPDGLAYTCRGTSATWADALDGARRAASMLAERGAGPGVHCALVLPTSVTFIAAFYGAQLLGAVPVAINPRLPSHQIRRRIDALECRVVVTTDDADALQALPPRPLHALPTPSPDDLSHLQITSGTTGDSRAVMLRHRNVTATVLAARDRLEPRPDDVFVGWLPLHHDFGLIRFLLGPLLFGCPSHLVESSMGTLPTWLETISRTRATITGAPDVAYRLAPRLVPAARVNLRSLRVATSGGEVVRSSTIRAFEAHFDVPGRVRPGYGLAEATLGVTSLAPGDPLRVDASGHVTCGQAMTGVTVRIESDDGTTAPAGTPGHIMVRSPGVFAGYLHDAAGTADVLRDGWLRTGDVGALDADGHLYVHGRERAMLKRGGAVIAPRELEEVADAVAGVRRSAAVDVRCEDEGSERIIIVAEVERHLGEHERRAARDAIAQVTTRAVGFSPHDIVLVAPGAIPRTATGKIRYDALRRQFTDP